MRRVVLFCLSLFVFLTLVQFTHAAWWDNSWLYRRTITISGSHPENYQLKIILPFFDNSIRFTENETGPLLPYWVENWTSDNMTVWVKRYQANGTDNIIYVYYGNPNAGRIDNGDATFDFFDNFDDGVIDSSKWQVYDLNGGAGTATESNGVMTLTVTTNGTNPPVLPSVPTFENGIYELVGKITYTNNIPHLAVKFRYDGTSSIEFTLRGGSFNDLYFYDGGYIGDVPAEDLSNHLNEWHFIQVKFSGTNVWGYVKNLVTGNSWSTSGTVTRTTAGPVGLSVWVASTTSQFDNVRVRKFLSVEPTTSVGTQEVIPLPLAINLLTESQTNPTRITTFTPHFSVTCLVQDNIYKGENLQIQVASDNSFSSVIWNNITNYSPPVENNGNVTITYSGSPLSRGVTYYWRARWYWSGYKGQWSSTATFRIANLTITSLTVDNTVVDRKVDWASGVTEGTTVTMRVWSELGVNSISTAQIGVQDNTGDAVIYVVTALKTNLDSENVLYTLTYNPADNAKCGMFSIWGYVKDSLGDVYTDWKQAFLVTDATASVNFENVPGHKIRVYGTVSLLTGGTYTLQQTIVSDNNLGDKVTNVTSPNYTVTYATTSGGTVTVKVVGTSSGTIDGVSLPASYPYPNYPPYLDNYWIYDYTPPLVDVDVDTDQDYKPNENYIWGIKCRDPDNDNLTITCRIYDNRGNLVFENSVQVWWDNSVGEYRTFRDNKLTSQGWFLWNPADNLPFGTCDIWVRLYDNIDNLDNTAYEYIYLNDITTTWGTNPANPFYRWEVTLSGYVQLTDFRPWSSSYPGRSNVWNLLGITSQTLTKENIKYLRLDDQFSGTFYPTITSPWSQTYIERAPPSQIVQVSLSVICDLKPSNPKVWVLDGRPGWSYTNDSRWKYAVRLMWEKGFDNLTDNQVENQYTYFVNFSYVTGETSGDNRLVRQYTEFILPYQIRWVTLKDNKNAYSRTLLENGRRYLDFYLIKQEDIDAGKCLSYLFKIDDPQGHWRNGWARWYKWVQGQPKRAITESYWGATGEIVVYLIYEETYNILLVSDENQELEYGFYVASANRTPAPLSPMLRTPLIPDPPTFWSPEYTLLFWYNWDNVDNSLHIYAQDKSGLTENIVSYLYPLKYASPASATNMMENQGGVFTTIFFASPENHWNITLELHRQGETKRMSYLISAVLHPSTLTAPSGVGEMVGAPVPLSAIFATTIALLFVLIFGQLNVGVGLMFSGVSLLLLKLIGMAVPGWLAGLLLFFGILAILYERRG